MYFQKKKWTTAKTSFYNNQKYDSNFEASYAQELDLRIKAGEIISYDRQVKIPLEVNGYHICNYYIDFIAYYPENAPYLVEYIETKGFPTPIWRLKWKMFEALYSEKEGVKLTIVQQGNFRIPKTKKIKRLTKV